VTGTRDEVPTIDSLSEIADGEHPPAGRRILSHYGGTSILLTRHRLQDPTHRPLLELPAVDVVYISHAAFLHYEQSKLALAAGKRVICEKPLALTGRTSRRTGGLARRTGPLLVANLMQRYKPVVSTSSARSSVASARLANSCTATLRTTPPTRIFPPEHWFWRSREERRNPFVEHGVHFFDMLTGWLGAGEVVSAQAVAVDGCEDQVQCTVRYPGGAHFNFCHGFISRGVWIARASTSSSNAATCCCKVGCQRASAFMRGQ